MVIEFQLCVHMAKVPDISKGTDIRGDKDQLREGPARMLAFSSRVARLLSPYSQQVRYLAFSSDVGEAARPVAHPRLVRASYALTWLYVFGDIGSEAFHQWKATPTDQKRIADKAIRTTVFQLLASVALPFLIIHRGVHVSSNLLRRYVPQQFQSIHKWGPSIFGLSLIPLFPVAVDHPIEQAVDWSFNQFNPIGIDKVRIE